MPDMVLDSNMVIDSNIIIDSYNTVNFANSEFVGSQKK